MKRLHKEEEEEAEQEENSGVAVAPRVAGGREVDPRELVEG